MEDKINKIKREMDMKTANVLVIGGSRTGKTFKYIKPTLLTSGMVLSDSNTFTSNSIYHGYTSKKWRIILSDVAKTFRRIHPELSENNAMETAKRFMESEKVASYCVGRWMRNGNSMIARQMKKKYGDEPFRFDRNGRIQGVNKFVLSKWILEK